MECQVQDHLGKLMHDVWAKSIWLTKLKFVDSFMNNNPYKRNDRFAMQKNGGYNHLSPNGPGPGPGMMMKPKGDRPDDMSPGMKRKQDSRMFVTQQIKMLIFSMQPHSKSTKKPAENQCPSDTHAKRNGIKRMLCER